MCCIHMHYDRDNNISHIQFKQWRLIQCVSSSKATLIIPRYLTSERMSYNLPVLQGTNKLQVSGQTCVSATFAVVTVLTLLLLAGVVITVVLRPQDAQTESNTELDSLKQELESLKEFTSQQANVTNELTKFIRFQESEIKFLKLNSQHSNDNTTALRSEIESLKQHFNESNYQTHIRTLS